MKHTVYIYKKHYGCNAQPVLYPYIWHMNLPCGFAKKFPVITWHVFWNQNKSSVSLTASHGEINGFVKLGNVPVNFDFLFAVYLELL